MFSLQPLEIDFTKAEATNVLVSDSPEQNEVWYYRKDGWRAHTHQRHFKLTENELKILETFQYVRSDAKQFAHSWTEVCLMFDGFHCTAKVKGRVEMQGYKASTDPMVRNHARITS